MPREGYVNFPVSDADAAMLDALCGRLRLPAGEHGARTQALRFCLRYVAANLPRIPESVFEAGQAEGGSAPPAGGSGPNTIAP